MAAISDSSSTESLISNVHDSIDRIKTLYPAVNEEETPLPRCWSQKDKFNCIGLSQNNLRVHYKGIDVLLILNNVNKQFAQLSVRYWDDPDIIWSYYMITFYFIVINVLILRFKDECSIKNLVSGKSFVWISWSSLCFFVYFHFDNKIGV